MKIGKNLYEFEVDGVAYRALFEHTHAPTQDVLGLDGETKRVVVQPIRIGRSVKAQHVTTCLFGTKEQMAGDFTFGAHIGIAVCSVKDTYRRLVGMKYAFERALSLSGIHFESVKQTDGQRELRFGSVVDRTQYGKFMRALFGDMHANGAKRAA